MAGVRAIGWSVATQPTETTAHSTGAFPNLAGGAKGGDTIAARLVLCGGVPPAPACHNGRSSAPASDARPSPDSPRPPGRLARIRQRHQALPPTLRVPRFLTTMLDATCSQLELNNDLSEVAEDIRGLHVSVARTTHSHTRQSS